MTSARPIVPCLWFDDQGSQAADFYSSLFPESDIRSTTHYGKEGFEIHGRPEGSVMTVSFRLAGQEFLALNGGPQFKFTPATSFFVICGSAAEVDALWVALSDGGEVLMELGGYGWSRRYGWLSDRYGLSWQVSLGDPAEIGQRIVPMLLFTGAQCGRAEAAMARYADVFGGPGVERIARYGAGEATPEGNVQHARFSLGGYRFMAMDSAAPHEFTFNEAVSFQVMCDSQAEIDHYWDGLGEGGDPAARQCGWLKDAFGVSWQIVPRALSRLLRDADAVTSARVTNAFLKMKKFDIAELERAYQGG